MILDFVLIIEKIFGSVKEMTNKLSKCSFCSYATKSGCMVTPNSYYCKKAADEYYQYIRNKNNKIAQPQTKSLRKWDKT